MMPFAALLAVLWSCLTSAAMDRAFQRGAACLERDMDGDGFRDPYLTYVYPDERLPTPPSVSVLTYRLVDAHVILAMLGRAGSLPAPLSGPARRAESILNEAAPLWRGRGFNNTIRSALPDGIALDTYCMVGWLLRDERMAREAAAAINGDRWIPRGWYDGPEAFRAMADECWCLRLTAATTGLNAFPGAEAVLDRIEREFLPRAQETHVESGLFYEAWHVGMVLAEEAARSPDGKLTRDRDPLLAAAVRVLDRWAAARPYGKDSSADVLEWSNLASADVLSLAGAEGERLKRRALAAALSAQGEDGCWSIHDARADRCCGPEAPGYADLWSANQEMRHPDRGPRASSAHQACGPEARGPRASSTHCACGPRAGSSFVTLRALLAFQRHRAEAVAATLERENSPAPAP